MKRMLVPACLFVTGALILACGGMGGEEEVVVEEVEETTPEAPAKAARIPFSQAAFACCGKDAASGMVGQYIDLQEALASDNLQKTRGEIYSLHGKAKAASKAGSFSQNSREISRDIEVLLEPYMSSPSIEEVRGVFDEVSDKIIALAEANKGGSDMVAVAFCPKANANWLQDEPRIQNPYYGKSNSGSGSFRE